MLFKEDHKIGIKNLRIFFLESRFEILYIIFCLPLIIKEQLDS